MQPSIEITDNRELLFITVSRCFVLLPVQEGANLQATVAEDISHVLQPEH